MNTHRHYLLLATGSAGMVMVGLCSLDWLREGDWCGDGIAIGLRAADAAN